MAEELIQERRKNEIYLNRAQATVYNFDSRNITVEAARATGKTSGMLAPRMLNCVRTQPMGFGAFLGCSLKQLFMKTVPNLIQAIEEITGLREGVHFVRGHAPKRLGFKEPLVRPKVWEQCIHFWNGCVIMMASTNVKAALNGTNLCFVLADECRFMKEDTIMGEVLPALRGLVTDHPGFDENKNHLYRSTMFVSDAPLTRSQGWMRKRKEQQTMEVNRKMAQMIREANELLQYTNGREDLTQNEKWQREFNKLRCQSSIFFSFSTLENIEILGESFIREQKRNLSEAQFNIAILNLDKDTYADGYYVCYDPNVHLYEMDDYEVLEQATKKYMRKTQTMITEGGRTLRIDGESIDLSALRKGDDCTMDVDILPTEPLRIALDYNNKMSCIVTGQTPSRFNSQVLKVLSSFAYIKADRVEGLMKHWCKYYEPHKATCKDVIFYYDSTAKQGGSYATAAYEETQFYNVVKKVLKSNGWRVIEVSMGTPMQHAKKYEIINNCFSGVMKPIIRINRENNNYLSTSLENAGVLPGFKKDKSKEKRATSADADEIDIERQLAIRTDMSDAFDTLLIGVRNFGSGGMGCIGGLLGG